MARGYHRTFGSGSHDVVLEFSADIGKWQLGGVGLVKFNGSGKMIEFEVMILRSRRCGCQGKKSGTGSARNWPG